LPELWDRERRTGDDLQKVRVQSEERGGAQVQGHDAHDEHARSSTSRDSGSASGRAARPARAGSLDAAAAAWRWDPAPAAQGHDVGRRPSFDRKRSAGHGAASRRTADCSGSFGAERNAPGSGGTPGQSSGRNPGCKSGRRLWTSSGWTRSLWWPAARCPERLRRHRTRPTPRLFTARRPAAGRSPGRFRSAPRWSGLRPASGWTLSRWSAAGLRSAPGWRAAGWSPARLRSAPGWSAAGWLRSAPGWSAAGWLRSASGWRSSVWTAACAAAGLRPPSGRTAHAGSL
jgi:hypothetical protein